MAFVIAAQIFLPGESTAQPKGEFLWSPILHENDESTTGSPDYVKLREFPSNSLEYKLGRKVAYVEIPGESFTGFLIGNDLLLTNHHCVYNSRNEPYPASSMVVYMEYWNDRDKGDISSRVTRILKSNEYLDYALLQLSEPLGLWYGYLELETNIEALRRVSEVKIIQHPKQRSKEIVIDNTEVTALKPEMEPEVIHYIADTEEGSSGSPVFSRNGSKVIALHHRGFSLQADRQEYNEGILISRIAKEISSFLTTSSSRTVELISIPDDVNDSSPGMSSGTKTLLTAGAGAILGIGGVVAVMARDDKGTEADNSDCQTCSWWSRINTDIGRAAEPTECVEEISDDGNRVMYRINTDGSATFLPSGSILYGEFVNAEVSPTLWGTADGRRLVRIRRGTSCEAP